VLRPLQRRQRLLWTLPVAGDGPDAGYGHRAGVALLVTVAGSRRRSPHRTHAFEQQTDAWPTRCVRQRMLPGVGPRATIEQGRDQSGARRPRECSDRCPATRVGPVDPSLSFLRHGDEAKRFVTLVGDPLPATLFALPLFERHRAALEGMGLADAQDLIDAPTALLMKTTGAAPHVVRMWKSVAGMAGTDATGKALPIDLLAVVVACGAGSRAQLKARLETAEEWTETVRAAMVTVARVEPTVDEWRGYVTEPPAAGTSNHVRSQLAAHIG
jgi:hypothetical protein